MSTLSSNDQNLNNPTLIDTLYVDRIIDMTKALRTVRIEQFLYDQIEKPDPYTCYIISDAKDNRMYYGTKCIIPSKLYSKYYITQDNSGEWVLVYNNFIKHDHLTEICRYKELQDAADAMALYNHVGSHGTTNLRIYQSLIQYIKEVIGIDDFILSILVIMNLSETPQFQELVQFLMRMNNQITHNTKSKYTYQQKITLVCAEEINRRSKAYPGSYYDFYNRIYNIILKNSFFKDKKYKDNPENVNLGDAIDEMVSTIVEWKYAPI